MPPIADSKQADVPAAEPLVAQPPRPAKPSQVATRLADFVSARAMPPSGSVAQSSGGALIPRVLASSQVASARVQPAVRPAAALARVFWHLSAVGETGAGTAGGRRP